jgi:hypothetical protein
MSNDSIPVDGPSSLAWRENDHVHLVLHLGDDAALAAGKGVVRFRQQGGHSFWRMALLEPGECGTTLRVHVPVRHFTREAWSIALRPADTDSFRRLETRILAHRGQPVALLPGPGPKPGPTLPEPEPRVVRQATRRMRHVVGRARDAVSALLGR